LLERVYEGRDAETYNIPHQIYSLNICLLEYLGALSMDVRNSINEKMQDVKMMPAASSIYRKTVNFYYLLQRSRVCLM